MNAHEAAEKIRPSFHLEQMPVEDRHHVKFVEDVATDLGIEHSAFNLHQVADALDAADIHQDSNEYPKMLFSRQHHAIEGVAPSFYDKRHDCVIVHVENAEEAEKLGPSFVDGLDKLPERGDTPIDAAPVEAPASVPLEPAPSGYTGSESDLAQV